MAGWGHSTVCEPCPSRVLGVVTLIGARRVMGLWDERQWTKNFTIVQAKSANVHNFCLLIDPLLVLLLSLVIATGVLSQTLSLFVFSSYFFNHEQIQ